MVASGTKTPLINTRGNLIMVDSIIMVDVWSVAGADSNNPKNEKHTQPTVTPTSMSAMSKRVISTIRRAKMIGVAQEMSEKMVDDNASPKRMAQKGTGRVTSRSSVWPRVSVGMITGPTAVEAKKTTIPSNPGINCAGSTLRPRTNDRKKKKGKRRPNINVGPLR